MQLPDTIKPSDDEIDLLDLLVALAENLKLLILGTLLAGVLGTAMAFAWPQTFASVSILSPTKSGLNVSGQVVASYIKSADILELVAQDLGFEPDISSAQRLKKLEKLVQVTVGKQDSPLVILTSQGPSPEQSQKLNAAIWKRVLPHTVPRGKELERLQQQLETERNRLASAEALEISTSKLLQGGATNESTARLYGELLAANSSRQRTISTLESQMEGLTDENLAQQPTLPELPIKPQKSLIIVGCTLAGAMLLLIFVFIRQVLRGASKDPGQAAKVARMRLALGLNP